MDETYINPTAAADDGEESTVDSQEETSEQTGAESSKAENSDKVTDSAGTEDKADPNEQTRRFNAAMRAARLQGKSEAEEAERKRLDTEIREMGAKNPYTGELISDLKSFREYAERFRTEQLVARAKKENRPVEELREEEDNQAYLSKLRREEKTESEKKRAEEEKKAWLVSDLKEFQGKHGDVNVAELEKNEKFRKFAGSRLYREPLSGIYEDFVELIGSTSAAAVAKQQRKDDRSVSSGGSTAGTALTASEQKSLNAWNERYPDKTLTAKEWRERHQ